MPNHKVKTKVSQLQDQIILSEERSYFSYIRVLEEYDYDKLFSRKQKRPH